MSWGGTVAAMITSLKNNNMLRIRRYKLFDKDRRELKTGIRIRKPKPYKHLSKAELKEVREELKEERKRVVLIQITIIIALLLVVGIAFYLFLFHLDPDKVNIFKRIEMYFGD